jgi:hypothetical protein
VKVLCLECALEMVRKGALPITMGRVDKLHKRITDWQAAQQPEN